MDSPSRRIRLAFCITELDPGGAERCLTEIVTRLDGRKFEPVVYCLGPRPSGNPISLAQVIESAGVPVHALGARGVRDARRTLRLLQGHLEQWRPDILQCFLFHANVLGAIAGHRAAVPHVLTGIRVAERRAPWHLALARYTDRWVERHVCVSEDVRDFSIVEGRLPAEKLVVIPNGVDVERFARARPVALKTLGVRANRRAILYVGRLDEQKGLAWFFEQLPTIFHRLPRHDLLLVGDGPQRGLLERLARETGCDDRIHFLGYRADVPEILADSDLLVLPSHWEGMPNVVLEAMAAGKPVVANAVEGVREALACDAQTCPVASPQLFVQKIVAILTQPFLAARLGRQNQQRVRGLFRREIMVQAYSKLYRQVAAAPLPGEK